MDDLYKLILIQIFMSIVSLAYCPLIPRWADIKAVQENLQKKWTDDNAEELELEKFQKE